MQISLAMVGFGNVGKAFARLLLRKHTELKDEYGVDVKVVGIATFRHGIAVKPQGIDLEEAIYIADAHQSLTQLSSISTEEFNVFDFISNCPADVLLENSPVNYHTGQPALDYIRAGINRGMHVITANKGPVVHGYHELTRLAEARGHKFLFESAVMDGAPIFSVFREALPAAKITGFQGILNSCTNLLLESMESGETLEDAVAYAQSIGIAETDPSGDVDGWDAAVKVAALATVLMDRPLKPDQVDRQGIRSITPQMIAEAQQAGEKWKLVCTARLMESGGLQASVSPQRISSDSSLYTIRGTSSYVQFETDVLPGLGIVESNPSPDTTAYGLLADLLNILRKG